jgi:hypothetical protein
MAQEGFRLNQTISYTAGICAAVVLLAVYLIALIRNQKKCYDKQGGAQNEIK